MRFRGAGRHSIEKLRQNTSSVRRPYMNEGQSGEVEAELLKEMFGDSFRNAFYLRFEEKQITHRNLRRFQVGTLCPTIIGRIIFT